MNRQAFLSQAEQMGFSGAAFVSTRPFDRWLRDAQARLTGIEPPNLAHDPLSLMPEARCLAVLFMPYQPMPADGFPLYARYYIASQKAYHAGRELADWLNGQGHSALYGPSLPHRAAALRAGGSIGDHGLFIHPQYGSFLHIGLLLTDAFEPDANGLVSPCSHCGRCMEACPVGAINGPSFNGARCLRFYYGNRPMPADMRANMSCFFGCELCQRACPQNAHVPAPAAPAEERLAVDMTAMLSGRFPALEAYIGSNYARPSYLASQAALIIGAKKLHPFRPQLEALVAARPEWPAAAAHARWALERLGQD